MLTLFLVSAVATLYALGAIALFLFLVVAKRDPDGPPALSRSYWAFAVAVWPVIVAWLVVAYLRVMRGGS